MSKKKPPGSSAKGLPGSVYKAELERLQIELVEMQQWVAETGARVLVIFEGRDAAGEGGAGQRGTKHPDPPHARGGAPPKPAHEGRGAGDFHRPLQHPPPEGERAVFRRFLRQAPAVEHLLIEDGIILLKYWFSVSDEEQQTRFERRLEDPLRRWKLSPTDRDSVLRWEDYSRAKDAMFAATDTKESPWWTVESDDKRSARLNMISHFVDSIPYHHLEWTDIDVPARPAADDYERPPVGQFHYVPDIASELSSKK